MTIMTTMTTMTTLAALAALAALTTRIFAARIDDQDLSHGPRSHLPALVAIAVHGSHTRWSFATSPFTGWRAVGHLSSQPPSKTAPH
jgi:hypothetical protein